MEAFILTNTLNTILKPVFSFIIFIDRSATGLTIGIPVEGLMMKTREPSKKHRGKSPRMEKEESMDSEEILKGQDGLVSKTESHVRKKRKKLDNDGETSGVTVTTMSKEALVKNSSLSEDVSIMIEEEGIDKEKQVMQWKSRETLKVNEGFQWDVKMSGLLGKENASQSSSDDEDTGAEDEVNLCLIMIIYTSFLKVKIYVYFDHRMDQMKR